MSSSHHSLERLAASVPYPTLGVLGGGQLGRMLAHAAQRMGAGVAVLDPAPDGPAAQVAQHHIAAAYDDPQGWQRLAACCDAVTTEFENVPAAALEWFAQRLPTSPNARAVAIAQDRALEKQHFTQCGVPCAPYALLQGVDVAQELAQIRPDALLPGILKTARLGYDGKGQIAVRSAADLPGAWAQLAHAPCILERRLPLALECSVLLARAADGHMVHGGPQRNVHRNGILACTYAFEGAVAAPLQAALVQATQHIAQALDYVGVLCVEYFVLQDASWVVNEMAPRPHNSAHYSIDACAHSQFDWQARAALGLPLPAAQPHSAAVMLNLLGDLWLDAQGQPVQPPWAQIQALPGAHLHLYGKAQAQRGRKMGHLTLTAPTPERAQQLAAQAAALLGLPFEALQA